MKVLSSFIFALYLFGCGPQYIQDPNAYVFVTSKYENEPENTILGALFKKAGRKLRSRVKRKVEDKVFKERGSLASKIGLD